MSEDFGLNNSCANFHMGARTLHTRRSARGLAFRVKIRADLRTASGLVVENVKTRLLGQRLGFYQRLRYHSLSLDVSSKTLSGHIWNVLTESNRRCIEMLPARKVRKCCTPLVLVVLWISMFWRRQNCIGSSLFLFKCRVSNVTTTWDGSRGTAKNGMVQEPEAEAVMPADRSTGQRSEDRLLLPSDMSRTLG